MFNRRKIRYAVVGAGHIAQHAVLPAFANAQRNSELVAIVSGSKRKRQELSRMYDLEHAVDYTDFDAACHSGEFDAVYIALPNHLHSDFAVRAARAGIHVLCEKPMAASSRERREMIAAANANRVKLMIAYRLHFDECNLEVIQRVRDGDIGCPRLFNASFTMQVRPINIRVEREFGGGPLLDLGIYCINAARYVFGEEPLEAFAVEAQGADARFVEVEEAISAVLRFPREKLAMFTCGFGSADTSHYQIIGSEGDIRVDPAYDYEEKLGYVWTAGNKQRARSFRMRDQFAPELIYFSDCILRDDQPEPGGLEGLNDVRIIEAIFESVHTGRVVPIGRLPTDRPPQRDQVMRRPRPRKHALIDAESAHSP